MIIIAWANYVGLPFLAYGVLVLLDGMQNNKRIVLGGCSLALAVLAREGLFLPITLGIFSLAAIDIYLNGGKALKTIHATSSMLLLDTNNLFNLAMG
jgi:hypothetical protein